jgi:hypothetical protein
VRVAVEGKLAAVGEGMTVHNLLRMNRRRIRNNRSAAQSPIPGYIQISTARQCMMNAARVRAARQMWVMRKNS